MADKLSKERRAENMRRIRSRHTAPEIAVRRLLRTMGGLTGYRLHRKDLPGAPDIAFVGRRKAIFVHGCFWHGHSCKEGVREPKSNVEYWLPKIRRNKERDAAHIRELASLGWNSLTIWECELKHERNTINRLRCFLRGTSKKRTGNGEEE